MNLPEIKKLKAIIKLCRKTGVESIEIDGVKLTLKDNWIPSTSKSTKAIGTTATTLAQDIDDKIESDGLSQDELLMWSSGGYAEQMEGSNE